MLKQVREKIYLGLFFVFIFSLSAVDVKASTFYGEVPTGLLELDYRYPVFMYVPTNYKPDRAYPLLITFPDFGESAESHIKYWTGWAKRRSMIVLSIPNLLPEDVPYSVDEWVLSIKEDLSKRYRVSADEVYLAGNRAGGHYAAYLGTNYPEEFNSAVLFDGSWTGQFDKLLRLQTKPQKQIPFLVVVSKSNQMLMLEVEQEALDLEAKGYWVKLIQIENQEEADSDEFKKMILSELHEVAETWNRKTGVKDKSIKANAAEWAKEFFAV